MTTTTTPLQPEVLDRLLLLQNSNRPVSVDEILNAANLSHLTTTSSSSTIKVEKSISTNTLAERRKIPISPEKLKLYNSQINNSPQRRQFVLEETQILKRLQEENAKLPTQDSEEYMLAHLEKQNALLNADPKSICIESNRLKADFTTIRNLVTDATFSPTKENYEETIQAMLSKTLVKSGDDIHAEEEEDWDFWQTIVEDFPTAVAKLPHLLAAKLRCGGVPHRIRGLVWQAMAQSSSLNLETVYINLSSKEDCNGYDRVIQRDLSRTFPQLDMFKDDGGDGQQAMGRLLKAYSLYDAHVGYCQGLAFLVGPLLMTMPENQAFCVFVRLMETYEMRTMFTLNMEGLHLRLHQFETLLAQQCPRLDTHLKNHSIHTAMYASQWYLTMFAYSFPISLVLRIYDLVFAEGAVETITRVAVAIMQKNEEILLAMDDFEQLMMYLSSRKLYEVAYQSDPQAVIADAMALSTVITKQKMDAISENYQREMEQEKTRAQQVLAVRFGGWRSPTAANKKTHNKRDSWFSWGQTTPTTTTAATTPSSIEANGDVDNSQQQLQQQQQDRTIPKLHEQIEELVTALSHMQKENSRITEELVAKQMREIDLMAERDLLLQKSTQCMKTNMEHHQPSPVESIDGDCEEEDKKLQELQKQAEFRGFVDSLKMSGDFGALIAGALTTTPTTTEQEQQTPPLSSITTATSSMSNKEELVGMEEVTAELVAIKLANFEMGLKYQNLCQEHETALKKLNNTSQGQHDLVNKIMSLQTTIQSLQIDKEQLLEERDHLIDEQAELNQKTLAVKKTCADLQLEKLALENENQRLTTKVKELEDQRREYLMPRGSFTEEVFAAHQTLFGQQQQQPSMSRRHTLQTLPSAMHEEGEYQAKYIESDLRCRELEKLLAETKFRLVEYETTNSCSSVTSSPRGSLQQNRRPNSGIINNKRSSLSALVKMNSNPSPPPSMDLSTRESTDSTRSTTSISSHNNKRSSVYSRFLNALGTGPLTEEAQELKEECLSK